MGHKTKIAGAILSLFLLTGCETIITDNNYIIGDKMYLTNEINKDTLNFYLINRSKVNTIVLKNNRGGTARVGLIIGKNIRENGFNTEVVGYCFSSCTYIFVGGVERTANYRSKLGFHNPRSKGEILIISSSNIEATNKTKNEANSYYASMGVNKQFMYKWQNYNGIEVYTPELSTLKKYNIITRVR